MITKFSPGDRVRIFERSQQIDGTVDGIWPDGTIRVKLDAGTGTISYHPKQIRKLVKRKLAALESANVVEKYGQRSAKLNEFDAETLCDLLKKFIGKRVRIVITEARP